MIVHYIDTCSLFWRYINGLPTPDVNALFDDPNKEVFTNEISVLEWSSALCKTIRAGQMPVADFDGHEMALFADIASGKLKVLPMGQSIQRGRDLIRYVTTSENHQLRTVDSIQLATGLELSTRSNSTIVFVTSDKKLYAAASLPIFNRLLSPVFLQP